MDLIPHSPLSGSLCHPSHCYKAWVGLKFPLTQSNSNIFYPLCIHWSTAAMDTSCKPFFFLPPPPPFFFFFLWETKTQWKIIFPSHKPTHEEVKNRWEQFLFPVLFCKTASHLKTCYQGIFVEPSVSPHHTQLIFNKKYIVLMFWGYPKIFTFRKRANQGQVRWTPVS